MKPKNFIKIFLLILLSTKPTFAQETPSTNSKNYETETIKKDNQIEIRLKPKNPPSPSKNSANPSDKNIVDSQSIKSSEDIIYKKPSGENDFDDSSLEQKNKRDNLIAWREQQKKLREDRIKQRNEMAKQKFLENKKRSIIKEAENEVKIRNKKAIEASNKNTSPNINYSNSSPSNLNSNISNSSPIIPGSSNNLSNTNAQPNNEIKSPSPSNTSSSANSPTQSAIPATNNPTR